MTQNPLCLYSDLGTQVYGTNAVAVDGVDGAVGRD
jgi:hypothetical protein